MDTTHAGSKHHVRDLVTPLEWQARVDLAACYRLVAFHGWQDMIYNHISLRVPGEDDAFLLNPYGLMFEEITASSLIKVDVEGRERFNPDPAYTTNQAGFVIHGAIHAARPDIHCVIHTHTTAGMSLSTLKCGFLPLTQSILKFRGIAYHDYEGIVLDTHERRRLVENLGDRDAMVLRNHGLLAGGRTVAEAFYNIYRMERASRVQLDAMACNTDIQLIPEDVVARTTEQFKINSFAYSKNERTHGGASRTEALEWAALLRMLDRTSGTGYKD